MAEYNSVNLGRIMPKYTGDYSTNVNYNTLDIVFYEGNSYIATQPSLRQTPAIDSEYWGLISGKGDKGDKGDTGPQGPQGDTGPQGPAGKDGVTPVVGGRNLFLGTGNWAGDSTRWTKRGTVTGTPETYRGMTIASTSGAWTSPIYMTQNAGILQVGKTYTFSTYVRNTSDTDTEVVGYYDDIIVTPNAVSTSLPAHTDWTRVSRTFKVIKDPTTSTQGIRWESQKEVTNGQIQFAGYKLEEGNIATDWSPAPEDVQSDISKRAIDTSVVHNTGNETIVGNKTLTDNLTVNNTMEANTLYKRVTSTGAVPLLEIDDTNIGIKQSIGHYYSSNSGGNGVTLGAGGITIIGGGESAKGLGDAINTGLPDTTSSGLPITDHSTEQTIIAADDYIYFMPGQQAGYPTLGPSYRLSSTGNIDKYSGSGWTTIISNTSGVLAQDSQVVHKSGDESVAGDKKFSGKVTVDNAYKYPLNASVPLASMTMLFGTISAIRVGNLVQATYSKPNSTDKVAVNTTSTESVPTDFRPLVGVKGAGTDSSGGTVDITLNPDGTLTTGNTYIDSGKSATITFTYPVL